MECRFCTENDNYLVFADGKIYSRYTQKILRPGVNSRGYHSIALHANATRKSYLVHRLVAEAFIPNPENKPEVNHINGNKLDNRVENLEWVTTLENAHHAIKTGLCVPKRNVRCVPVQMFSKTGEFIAEFYSISEASHQTGIILSGISEACKGNQKTSGGYIWKYA